MAEAHSAVAFSFNVTPDGVAVRYNHDALKAVWYSGVHSWRRRFIRFKNHLINTLYPAPPTSMFVVVALVVGAQLYSKRDLSYGLVDYVSRLFPECVHEQCELITAGAFGLSFWVGGVMLWRLALRLLLRNHSWMYEPYSRVSLYNKAWLVMARLLKGSRPLLYSYQAALPRLPVPSLQDTQQRYLRSIRPLKNDEEYAEICKLADEFFNGIAHKLQRYLVLKSWWAPNYVSDWWEQYVYLRGRSPLPVNSNYYGLDAIFVNATTRQAARAGNMCYAFLKFKEQIETESMQPLLVNDTVPLCSLQYERMYNTIRQPGVETDTLVQARGVNHIVVLHRGRYFKVYTHNHGELLTPREFEAVMEHIIADTSEPAKGELHLAALTAGERIPWAHARQTFFSSGPNFDSLSAIEKASFVIVLDEEEHSYDPDDPTKLNRFARAMLHGKCYDRWFDKSMTLVITANGRVGFNAEHSWADAPVMSQLCEVYTQMDLLTIGYDEAGHCKGTLTRRPPVPIRLQWSLPSACIDVIQSSLNVAEKLANDIDLHLQVHQQFGKGIIKKCRVSPDAFIQMALQLAYYRDAGKFSLTYEASMTRLFREGRTETVRSCTNESSAFVLAVESGDKTKAELRALLNTACDIHVNGYRDAMTGKGIDRHLFCLYVISQYLQLKSPFLEKMLAEPWVLSTSQTPHSQLNLIDLTKHPKHVCAGGGFGPVSDVGYGVSYIIAGEDTIFFHISSKISCSHTSSIRFGERVVKAMADIREICGQ